MQTNILATYCYSLGVNFLVIIMQVRAKFAMIFYSSPQLTKINYSPSCFCPTYQVLYGLDITNILRIKVYSFTCRSLCKIKPSFTDGKKCFQAWNFLEQFSLVQRNNLTNFSICSLFPLTQYNHQSAHIIYLRVVYF
jgi:hypothetical protein